MKIIEKIKFKVKKKKVREIKLFGISIIRYKLIKYKNRFFKNKLFFLPINYHKKSKQVFYLKINRNDDNEHWSFGITYVNNKIDWLKVINNKLNEKEYEKEKNNWNIDWFFTYLKKVTNYRIETFYIENLKFIHYGNFLVQPVGAYFYQWKNGNLMLPNITNVFNVANDKIKRLAIPDEIIKFDYNISEQEDFQYINSKGNG